MTGGLVCRRMCVAVCLRTSREYLVPCDLEAGEGRNCAKGRVWLALSWTIPRVVPVVLWVDCNGLSLVGAAHVQSCVGGVNRYPVGRTQEVDRVIFPVP